MDHTTAEPLLEEFVAGKLTPERAAEVESHVRGCAECAPHADLLRGIRREVAARGEALFTPHLTSDELARLELRAETLSVADVARFGAHVRACPTCAAERKMIRDSAGPAPWRAFLAWLSTADQPSAWLRPALGLLVVLLAWPAWLGMVEYPRAREDAAAARAEAEKAHVVPPPGALVPAGTTIWNGGAAAVLILAGATRGSAATPPATRLKPGQPGLTIVTDRRLTQPDSLLVTLWDDQHRLVWKQPVTASELWDASARVTSVMIPAGNLTPPGDYSIEIGPAAGPPQFQARFRISP
jgi:hypothetical protein